MHEYSGVKVVPLNDQQVPGSPTTVSIEKDDQQKKYSLRLKDGEMLLGSALRNNLL